MKNLNFIGVDPVTECWR